MRKKTIKGPLILTNRRRNTDNTMAKGENTSFSTLHYGHGIV